jgi:hypothetical protein
MSDKKTLAFKSFNPKDMLSNIDLVKGMIQRIRQKEGGIGSEDDELALHRIIHDLDLLVDMVDGVKASYDDLKGQFNTTSASVATLQSQLSGLKGVYEKMLQDRNDRIKELETQLGSRPKKRKKKTE